MNDDYARGRGRPSLFWPIILIGAGLIWLLSNLGILTINPWALLWRLWPVFLIAAGLDILLQRAGTWGAVLSLLLGLLVVGGVVMLLLFAQVNTTWLNSLGANPFGVSTDLHSQNIADPLGSARQADVSIGFPGGEGSINSLGDSGNLIEGDLTYYGDLVHQVNTINDRQQVQLNSRGNDFSFFPGSVGPKWTIRLNPAVTYALELDTGSGSYNFDLTSLKLDSLSLNHGSGTVQLALPASGQYRLTCNSGSGNVDIRVPSGVGVRVLYHVGSGSLNTANLRRVSGDEQNGTLESNGFSQASSSVTVNLNLGSGTINFR